MSEDKREFACNECDAEFDLDYDFVCTPDFCPFCGNKLEYDDLNVDWEDDSSE